MTDIFDMQGRVTVLMASGWSPSARWWTAYDDHNVVTNQGRSAITHWLNGGGFIAPNWLGVGSGTASATAIQASGLQFEMDRNSAGSRTLFGPTAYYLSKFTPVEVTGLLLEVGLFSNSAGGIPNVCYAVAAIDVDKSSGNQMQVVWQLGILTGSGV